MSLTGSYQFKYPPIKQLCVKHRMATRIWKWNENVDENQSLESCGCCGRKIGEAEVYTPCCYNSDKLSLLGLGLPLFFSFLRYSILLVFILLILYCVFGLYTNVVSQDCEESQNCWHNVFNRMSILNKKNKEDYLQIQNYILLAFVVLCIFIFQCFRYRFRKIVDNIDEFIASPGDYSIILRRLPEDIRQADILQMIRNKRQFLSQKEIRATQNLKVQTVVLAYDLSDWYKKKQQIQRLFKNAIKEGKRLKDHELQLGRPTKMGNFAIVVFSKQESKFFFLEKPKLFQRVLHYFCSPCAPLGEYRLKNKRICIQRAPQPDDIIWRNSTSTVRGRVCRKLSLGCITLILLAGGGFAQYGLALLQNFVEDELKKILVGLAASVVVAITNFILQQFLISSTHLQKMPTMTDYIDAVSFKLVFHQFLNSGIFVVAAYIAANYQTFQLQTNLAQTVTLIMILNALLTNFTNFILYKWDIFGRVMRYICIRKKWAIYSQLEANELWVMPQPMLYEKYSFIIKTVWLSAFYCPFVPIVVPISIVGLLLNYIVEKYLFRGLYSAPNMISTAVNEGCFELFQYVPLIMSLGQFLIYYYLQNFDPSNILAGWPFTISIGISLINLLLPMKQINKGLCKIQVDLSQEPTYKEIAKDFQVTYESTNPAYQVGSQSRLRERKVLKKSFVRSRIVDLGENKNKNNSSTTDRRMFSNPSLNNELAP